MKLIKSSFCIISSHVHKIVDKSLFTNNFHLLLAEYILRVHTQSIFSLDLYVNERRGLRNDVLEAVLSMLQRAFDQHNHAIPFLSFVLVLHVIRAHLYGMTMEFTMVI